MTTRRQALLALGGGALAFRWPRTAAAASLCKRSPATQVAPCRPGGTSVEDRVQIVETGLRLLLDNYVHFERKRYTHGAAAVERLRQLLEAVQGRPADRPDEAEFHHEVLHAFFALRDRHMTYNLPAQWDRCVLRLPFEMRETNDQGRRYIVSRVESERVDPQLAPGVEIVSWNGLPTRRRVAAYAAWQPYGNPHARRAMAVDTMTAHFLSVDPAPEETHVTVGFRTRAGSIGRQVFEWIPGNREDADTECRIRRKGRWGEFEELCVDEKAEGLIAARRYTRGSRTFGYVRLLDIGGSADGPILLAEFIRLLRDEFPDHPLIIDLRDNDGGRVETAECLLQALTTRVVARQLYQFRNTGMNLAICEADRIDSSDALRRYVPSIAAGLKTGEAYSAGFPKSAALACDPFRRKSAEPMVLITSALSFSAAELFAAGFQDHGLGKVIGVDPSTGGGGGNQWGYARLGTFGLPGCPYPDLAEGADFGVTMRRVVRVGSHGGEVVEDFGVEPDELHALTAEDVTNFDADLIVKAMSML